MRNYKRTFGITAVATITSALAAAPPARADDPVRGAARNITQDDTEEVRDLLEDVVEEALTRDEFDAVVDRLTDRDQERLGEAGDRVYPALNKRIDQIRQAWRAKYGREFDIGDEEAAFRTFNAAQTVADQGDPQDTLRAAVTIPATAGIPAAKLRIANQKVLTVDRWRIDIDDKITAEQLVKNLTVALEMIERNSSSWPADRNAAYGYVAAHVLSALANPQFDSQFGQAQASPPQGGRADGSAAKAPVIVAAVVPAAEQAAAADKDGQANKADPSAKPGKSKRAARNGQARATDDAGKAGQPGQSGQAPEGFVLIEERVVVLTANEPQNHFLRAAEYLSKNSPQQAAGEVRIGAAYLDMQASRAKGGTGKQELSGAADELRQAADTIQKSAGQQGNQQQANQQGQKQQQQQVSQVTQAFAQANLALARHFQSLADRAAQNKKAIMAGHDLDAAASALQAALTWSGQKPEQEALTAIVDARRLSMQLLSPAGQPAGAGQGNAPVDTQGDDAAQPAAARVGSNQGQSGGQMPGDASRTIDQLASAIQKCSQSIGKSDSGNQPKQDGQSGQSAKSGEKGQSDKKDK